MPDCVENRDIYDVGCFTHCGKIDSGLIANHSGIHTIVFSFRGVTTTHKVYARKGQSIIFNDYFNEDAETLFKIYEPNGDRYVFSKYWQHAAHCSEHDLFKITIKIGKAITEECNTICCSEPKIICAND
jgi:hypothetical protein